MEATLLERLSGITPEERRILAGESGLDRSLYTAGQDPVFRQQRLMRREDPIQMRTHTRFVEFPLHGHNFVEMMVCVSGSIEHTLQGKRILLRTGDLLLMDRHILHAISRAGREDMAMLTTLAGLVIVLLMVVNLIADFFGSVRSIFQLY